MKESRIMSPERREHSPLVAVVKPGAFPVVQLPAAAPESGEGGGTTNKFWFDGKQVLFKQARPGTGEHWAERIACELAGELGLPTPHVELARWQDQPGVIICSFLDEGEKFVQEKELLERLAATLPEAQRAMAQEHTLPNVFRSLEKMKPPNRWRTPPYVSQAAEAFIAYLMFDAWIGNDDRRDENWGIVEAALPAAGTVLQHLAPTFDHAASLGRELDDQKRAELLAAGKLEEYATRCKSGICKAGNGGECLTTHVAFEQAARLFPDAAAKWLENLFSISDQRIHNLFDKLPGESSSPLSRDFALAMLRASRDRLKRTAKQLQ